MAQNEELDIYGGLPDYDFDKKFQELEVANKSLRKRVKELECSVQCLTKENSKLSRREKSLDRNISVLYTTALAEIEQKNKAIADLTREKDSILFRRNQRRNDEQQLVQQDSPADLRPSRSRHEDAYRGEDVPPTKSCSDRSRDDFYQRESSRYSSRRNQNEDVKDESRNRPSRLSKRRDTVEEKVDTQQLSSQSTEDAQEEESSNLNVSRESKLVRAEILHQKLVGNKSTPEMALKKEIKKISPKSKKRKSESFKDTSTSSAADDEHKDLLTSLLATEKKRINGSMEKKRRTRKQVLAKFSPRKSPRKVSISPRKVVASPQKKFAPPPKRAASPKKEVRVNGFPEDPLSLSPEFNGVPETPGKSLGISLEVSPLKVDKQRQELDSAVFSILPTPLKLLARNPMLSPLQKTPFGATEPPKTNTSTPEEPKAEPLAPPKVSEKDSPPVLTPSFQFKRKRVLKIKCSSGNNSLNNSSEEPPPKKACAPKAIENTSPPSEQELPSPSLRPAKVPKKITTPKLTTILSPVKVTPAKLIQSSVPGSVSSTGRKSNDSCTSQEIRLHYTSESEVSRSPSPFLPQQQHFTSSVATSTPHPGKKRSKIVNNHVLKGLTPNSKKKQKRKIIMSEMFGASPQSERDYHLDLEVTEEMRKDLQEGSRRVVKQDKRLAVSLDNSPPRSRNVSRYSPDRNKCKKPSPDNFRKRSPEERRRSPEARRRSPADTRRYPSPVERRRSPEERRRSPENRRGSPEEWRRSPEERKRTPDLRKRSPEVRRRSPELRRKSPEERRRSPEERRRSPPPPARRRSPFERRRSPVERRRSPVERKRSPEERYRRKSPDERERRPSPGYRDCRRSPVEKERLRLPEERRKDRYPEELDSRDRRYSRRSRSVERQTSGSGRRSPVYYSSSNSSKRKSPVPQNYKRSVSPRERRREYPVSPPREEERRRYYKRHDSPVSPSPPPKLNGSRHRDLSPRGSTERKQEYIESSKHDRSYSKNTSFDRSVDSSSSRSRREPIKDLRLTLKKTRSTKRVEQKRKEPEPIGSEEGEIDSD